MRPLKKWWALLFVVCLLSSLSACATLPPSRSVPDIDQNRVAREFRATVERQADCSCCLDAQVRVKVKSWLQNGTLDGFLQAKEPSFFKFVGLTPLGQPLLILTSDGTSFRYIVVPEKKGYEGSVDAEKFIKNAPKGFRADQAFSLFSGRMPQKAFEILDVRRDAEGIGYWLELAFARENVRHHVQYLEDAFLIRRHIILGDTGDMVIDLLYQEYQPVSGNIEQDCRLPGRLTIRSKKHNGASMEAVFSDWLSDANFTAADFEVKLPPGFIREVIK